MIGQDEQSAIDEITQICNNHLKSPIVVVVTRKPINTTSYIAEIGVASRDGSFSQAFFKEMFELFAEKDCLYEFGGTQRDIKDLSFEEFYIRAKITII